MLSQLCLVFHFCAENHMAKHEENEIRIPDSMCSIQFPESRARQTQIEYTLCSPLQLRRSIKLCSSATDSLNFPDDGKTLTDLHKLYPSKQNVAKQDGGAQATGGRTSTLALWKKISTFFISQYGSWRNTSSVQKKKRKPNNFFFR